MINEPNILNKNQIAVTLGGVGDSYIIPIKLLDSYKIDRDTLEFYLRPEGWPLFLEDWNRIKIEDEARGVVNNLSIEETIVRVVSLIASVRGKASEQFRITHQRIINSGLLHNNKFGINEAILDEYLLSGKYLSKIYEKAKQLNQNGFKYNGQDIDYSNDEHILLIISLLYLEQDDPFQE